MEKNHAEEVVR